MKKSIGLLLCSFCMALLAVAMLNPLKAEAAGRNVTIKYETDAWYTYVSTEGYWKDYVSYDAFFEDGDVILIDGGNSTSAVNIELNVNKAFKTVAVTGQYVTAFVTSKSVEEVYAANKATLIYTGEVNKVAANAGCVTQIMGNAKELEVLYEGDKVPVFAVTGTVGTYKGKVTDGTVTADAAYNLAAGTVHAYADDKGVLKLAAGTLNGTPAASGTTPDTNKKELDEVPKTGNGVSTSALFFALSAIFAITAVTLKKRESAK